MNRIKSYSVTSAEYATESEVIRDGLRVLMARDRAVERWLREQVVPAYAHSKPTPRGPSLSRQAGAHTTRGRTQRCSDFSSIATLMVSDLLRFQFRRSPLTTQTVVKPNARLGKRSKHEKPHTLLVIDFAR